MYFLQEYIQSLRLKDTDCDSRTVTATQGHCPSLLQRQLQAALASTLTTYIWKILRITS